MKTIKRISGSLLLAIALICSFQFNASANERYPDARITSYSEDSTFHILSGSLEVRNYPGYDEPAIDRYYAGESFNYDSIYNFEDFNHYFKHRYASYVSTSGVRRYVPFQMVKNGVVTRFASYTVE